MACSKLFDTKEMSEKYAKFRPIYPPTVSEIIRTYMKSHGSLSFKTAVDVACGSGQSTFLLSDSFDSVTGVDISEHQIEQAKRKASQDYPEKSNVKFIVGDAHSLLIDSSSVDVVTCATAWHWLNPELFYEEVRRVLKPGGCLAVYNIAMRIVNNRRMRRAFEVFIDELHQNDCFSEQNLHALNEYRAVQLPLSATTRIEFDFPQRGTIDQLLGLMSSVSMYKCYCEKFPESDLLVRIKTEYSASCSSDKVVKEEFSFPGYVILGTK